MLSESASSCPTPQGEYSRRLHALEETHSKKQRRVNWIGYSKLIVSGVTAVWLLLSLPRLTVFDLLLLIPALIFIVLAIWQEREIRALRYTSRAIEFYQRGLRRLNDQWAGSGEAGDRFLDPAHPYARDLDIFGRGSLFELLCTARTRAGEETLARWLSAPASLDEIHDREGAVVELRERLDFREKLFGLGQDLRLGVRPQQLVAWGEQKPLAQIPRIRITAMVLGALWLLSVAAWVCAWLIQRGVTAPGLRYLAWGNLDLVFLVTLVNLVFSYRRRAITNSVHAIEEAGQDLKLLSEVLSAFESAPFASRKLVELQRKLKHDDIPPSNAIHRFERLVEYLESAHNLFVRIFDPVIFWTLQLVLAAENWRESFGPSIREWMEAVGELEALLSLSGYAYEHPSDVFPDFVQCGVCFHAEALAHPLLGSAKAVSNDLRLDQDLQAIILSGPNMAGKSTFLRGIGVNAVLAQAGGPVRARSLTLSRLAVTASICVLDSLQGGTSRFYAEIKRLKQISDLTKNSVPVLFLLDELFSGTNSHDRLIGTRSIVENLIERGAIGLVTTHDLALTQIPQEIGARATNYHFEDHIEDGELQFDYKLRPGVVQTSNALQLMRSIGLEV